MKGTEHFVVTGGTGLVGADLVPRLLHQFPGSTMTLIVRARDAETAVARVRTLAEALALTGRVPDAPERLSALRGDVTLEGCGLAAAEQADLAGRTTHIIHGAATIRFDHPIEDARAVNGGGTRNILAIARRCAERGRLERFVWIGTSSVSGRRSGRILEDELEMGQEFFNTYEQSKCEAERMLRNAMPDLPITICRPSIIIGNSRTGHTSTFNVIYIPLRLLYMGLLTAVPGRPETTLDLVPVDWVNDVITHLTAHPDAVGAVCHVTAGRERAALLGDLVSGAAAYFDLHAPLRAPRAVEFIPGEEFERRKAALGGRQGALLAQLDTLLPYVSIDRLFDSTATDRLLRGSGVSFPPFNSYAERILAYCLDSDWGRREVPVVHERIPRTAM